MVLRWRGGRLSRMSSPATLNWVNTRSLSSGTSSARLNLGWKERRGLRSRKFKSIFSTQVFTSPPLEVQGPALPAVVEAEDGGHQVEGDVQRHYLQVQGYWGARGEGGRGGTLLAMVCGQWSTSVRGVLTGGGEPTDWELRTTTIRQQHYSLTVNMLIVMDLNRPTNTNTHPLMSSPPTCHLTNVPTDPPQHQWFSQQQRSGAYQLHDGEDLGWWIWWLKL